MKSSKSYKKKDDCKQYHLKIKSNKVMYNDQSSSLSAGNSSGRRSCSCSRSPSSSCYWSCSCSSGMSYDKHHVAQDDCKPSTLPKRGYLYSSKSGDNRCICWLPYLQNYITGNIPYGTGNTNHTGNVIFKRYVTGTSAAKAGSPYLQRYFTSIAPKYDVQYR